MDWISVCMQLSEAVMYLHFDAQILHNDIKPVNILLSNMHRKPNQSPIPLSIFVILSDFGKVTSVNSGKRYNLCPID